MGNDLTTRRGVTLAQNPGPGTARRPAPTTRLDPGPAGSDSRAKQDLLVTLARELVEAPDDVTAQHVRSAQEQHAALQAAADALAAELARTLGPWTLDQEATRDEVSKRRRERNARLGKRHNRYLTPEDRAEELSDLDLQVWTRRQMSRGTIMLAIVGSPTVGWSFGTTTHQTSDDGLYGAVISVSEFGSFKHADLAVAKAMADMMARLKGCRMSDPEPVETLMLAAGDRVQPVRPSLAGVEPRLLPGPGVERELEPDVQQQEPEPVREEVPAEPDSIWAPVFSGG